MRSTNRLVVLGGAVVMTVGSWMAVRLLATPAQGQGGRGQAAASDADEAIHELVGRLTLANYKGTVKGLTNFGDRRQGTKRNQDAVDWIEGQLKSFGYTDTARVRYDFAVATRPCGPSVPGQAAPAGAAGRAGGQRGQGGQRQGAAPAGGAQGRGGGDQGAGRPTPTGGEVGRGRGQSGGSTVFGYTARTGVNCDPALQPDAAIRELDSQPVVAQWAEDVYVHQGRHDPPGGDVHHRRPHGRTSATARRPTMTDRARRW